LVKQREKGSNDGGKSSFHRGERRTWQGAVGEGKADVLVMEAGMALSCCI